MLLQVPDPDIREILLKGEIRLYSVTGAGEGLRALLLDIIATQRDRLLLRQGGTTARPTSAT
jgi:hypothetical protein